MKHLFNFLLIIFLISTTFIAEVYGSDDLSTMNQSIVKIAEKYAEKFCTAKDDYLFEGLKNEKDLKYSYFRYISSYTIDTYSSDTYEILLSQIKGKCKISNEEESELMEFFKNEFQDS